MLQSFTPKLGQKPRRIDKAKLKNAFANAISGRQVALQLVNQLPTSAGPPGLQAGINGLLFVLGTIQLRYLCSN